MPARGQEDPEEVVRQVMGVSAPARVPQAQESTVPCQDGGIERDKTKRVNRFGGFQPFTDQEKTIIYAEEEARLGRKLRQDEKTNLFGPPVLLANSVEDDFDPTGWLESEKLDGVRAYWSGVQFISRQGNVYEAPDFFVAELPQVPLDGELWMGRKQFQKTISVVRSAGSGQAWDKVSFVVFDAPNRTEGFEQRLTYLAGLELGHFAHVHPHSPCKSRAEAEAHLKQATADGAEGLMYRKPGSSYEPRRSSTLMKFKPFKDAEAVVIRHVAGKGRHKGRLGGLEVRMADGKTFNVGTGLTDRERDNPPKVGATITYRFADTTSDGIPKCASFVAVRDYE
jgi:DNA ligase-1